MQTANCHRNGERVPKCIQLYLLSVRSVKQPEAKIQMQKKKKSKKPWDFNTEQMKPWEGQVARF